MTDASPSTSVRRAARLRRKERLKADPVRYAEYRAKRNAKTAARRKIRRAKDPAYAERLRERGRLRTEIFGSEVDEGWTPTGRVVFRVRKEFGCWSVKPILQRRQRQVNRANKRGRKEGLPYGIKVSDIHWPERCPVLGVKLGYGDFEPCPAGHRPSLDKIVPAKGYVPGNVIVVSVRANTIKSDASIDELVAVAGYYEVFHG